METSSISLIGARGHNRTTAVMLYGASGVQSSPRAWVRPGKADEQGQWDLGAYLLVGSKTQHRSESNKARKTHTGTTCVCSSRFRSVTVHRAWGPFFTGRRGVFCVCLEAVIRPVISERHRCISGWSNHERIRATCAIPTTSESDAYHAYTTASSSHLILSDPI